MIFLKAFEKAWIFLKDRQTILPIDGQEGFLSHKPFEEIENNEIFPEGHNPRFWMGDKNMGSKSLQYDNLRRKNDFSRET